MTEYERDEIRVFNLRMPVHETMSLGDIGEQLAHLAHHIQQVEDLRLVSLEDEQTATGALVTFDEDGEGYLPFTMVRGPIQQFDDEAFEYAVRRAMSLGQEPEGQQDL